MTSANLLYLRGEMQLKYLLRILLPFHTVVTENNHDTATLEKDNALVSGIGYSSIALAYLIL